MLQQPVMYCARKAQNPRLIECKYQQLFNDGRVFESQGNIAAAQRLYAKVTKIEPR